MKRQKAMEYVGKRFGDLEILEYVHHTIAQYSAFKVICHANRPKCNNIYFIPTARMRGIGSSCGCVRGKTEERRLVLDVEIAYFNKIFDPILNRAFRMKC